MVQFAETSKNDRPATPAEPLRLAESGSENSRDSGEVENTGAGQNHNLELDVVGKLRKPMPNFARGVPICGFTGINGAGKTLVAVDAAIHDMTLGRDVYSTVPIEYGPHRSKPILSLRQLLHIESATILLDDVSVIFSSRSTHSVPQEIVTLLQVLRHRDLTVLWTAPEWMRADSLLRGVTQGLVNVVPLLRRADNSTPWPSPRLVYIGLMDTSTGKADATPTRVLRRRAFIPSMTAAWGSYDTLADTPQLGGRDLGGLCVDCYGTQTRPKHSRERHEAMGLPYYLELEELPVAVSDGHL